MLQYYLINARRNVMCKELKSVSYFVNIEELVDYVIKKELEFYLIT